MHTHPQELQPAKPMMHETNVLLMQLCLQKRKKKFDSVVCHTTMSAFHSLSQTRRHALKHTEG